MAGNGEREALHRMSVEYAYIILAVVALVAGILYMQVRRRRRHKKSAPPVRPAAPASQTAGVASTWAPPAMATHAPSPIAPTVVVPPSASPSWDQPAASPAKPGQGTWGAPEQRAAPRARPMYPGRASPAMRPVDPSVA